MTLDHDSNRHRPEDDSSHEGAVAQDRPGQPNNVASLNEQIDHRDQQPIKKGQDTDFPEPGSNPEYSMQKQENEKPNEPNKPGKDPDGNAAGEIKEPKNVDVDPKDSPGELQKNNQNKKKDDDLAA